MFIKINSKFCCRILILAILTISAKLAYGSTQTPVNFHAVNYSDQYFEYQLLAPSDTNNRIGGESIDRFAAGGTICCFELKNKWQPGLKVQIDYVYYLPKKADGIIPEIKKSVIADIPRYIKPSEIWVIRSAEGVMTIVVSNYQPNHPLWPGKIKGWPVPSLSYKRERMDMYINQAKVFLDAAETLSKNMNSNPDATAKEAWEFEKVNKPKNISGFNGYQDKRYHTYLRNYYQKSVIENREVLIDLERNRP